MRVAATTCSWLADGAMSPSHPDGRQASRRPPADPRRSNSLQYGVALLERFTAERSALGIAELAEMIELSRSSTHRYAATLAALGYLEQDRKRRYRLSDATARPGMSAIGALRAETPEAAAVLEDLREYTGHTVSMAALDGNGAIYIHRLFAHGVGQYETDLDLRVGARVPTHCTAIGKALLASLSEPEQRELLADIALERAGPNTITSKSALAQELARVRVQGIATCDEEQAIGVPSIAAPIAHAGRSRALAIGVTVPGRRYTVKAMTARFEEHVKAAAERI
jgi:DNA-binding IclR family transcriptional regulator